MPKKGADNISTRSKRVNARLTEKEYRKIESRAKKAKMSISQYLVVSATKDTVFIFIDLKDIIHHLSKIGNNINQLTMLAHQGKLQVIDLSGFKKELKEIWLSLSKSTEKTRRIQD
jgi:hypothetical protein